MLIMLTMWRVNVANPDELESDLQDNVSQGLKDGDVEQAFINARDRLTQTFKEIDRDELVNILVERTDMSQSEAQDAVDKYSDRIL